MRSILNEEVDNLLYLQLENHSNLIDLHSILVKYKNLGFSKEEVDDFLVHVKHQKTEHEDAIMELLDIVHGFCQQKYIIWD